MGFDAAGTLYCEEAMLVMQPSAGSMSAWVQFNSIPTVGNDNYCFLSLAGLRTDWEIQGMRFGLFHNFDDALFAMYFADYTDTHLLEHTTTPATSTDYHVAITWSGDSGTVTWKIFVNGTKVEDTSANGVTIAGIDKNQGTGLGINNHAYGYDMNHDGPIAECAMWDVELSDSQVSDLYNGGDGERADNVGSPVAYWRVSPESPVDDPEVCEISSPTNDLDHSGSPSFSTHPFDSSPGGGGVSFIPNIHHRLRSRRGGLLQV